MQSLASIILLPYHSNSCYDNVLKTLLTFTTGAEDMGIFQIKIKVINNFLYYFKPIFSKKQFITFCFFIYAMFKQYRRLSLFSMTQATSISYQRFQYFVCDSKWSIDDLNKQRIKLFHRQRTTASSSDGCVVIDDTASPKPYSKHTEGAKYQYCAPLKREEVCNVVVASVFSSQTKSFPINLKFYKPEQEFVNGKADPRFKSKLDLAKELIEDALDKMIEFKYLLLDAWYGNCSGLLEFIAEIKDLLFISELKDTRKVQFFNPLERKHSFIRVDELVKLIKRIYPTKLKPLTIQDAQDNSHTVWTYSFKSKLNKCSVPVKVVVMFGKWNKNDSQPVHVFVTNATSLSYKSVISTYRLRWGIERIFQELKDVFCFDQYQLRFKPQIEKFWFLCITAWSLVYFLKQNNYLGNILKSHVPLDSFHDYKRAINSLLIFDSHSLLSKNKSLAQEYFPVKSKRFLKRYAYAMN